MVYAGMGDAQWCIERMKYCVTAFTGLETIEGLNVTHSFQEYPTHYHDCFCFSVVSEGIFIEDGRLTSYDKLLITNPMQVHDNQTYGGLGYSLTTLYVNQDIVNYASVLSMMFSFIPQSIIPLSSPCSIVLPIIL